MALSLTLVAWQWVKFKTQEQSEIRFDFLVEDTLNNIVDRMRDYEQVLSGGAALFAASQTVERQEWHAYVEHLSLQTSYPGIQGMGFSIHVSKSGLVKHLSKIRAEGFPAYRIWPEGERDEYTSIIYLEPFDWRNQRAFGYDMFSEPVRHVAMTTARDSGQTSISGKVKLVQETDKDVQMGFLMYLPVYRNGIALETLEQRREALFGYVYAPFRMNDLMEGILGNKQESLDLEIYDGTEISSESLMYDSAPAYSCHNPSTLTTFN
jgi:CHASE1-domain containing sensor protein